MTERIFYYIFFSIFITLLGAFLSYKTKQSRIQAKAFLGIASGFLLGITLFHYFPESSESSSLASIVFIFIGFISPILLNVLFKSDEHENHSLVNGVTLISFSLHALFDGLLLDASTVSEHHLVFYGILIHRLPVAFSLFTIFSTHNKYKKYAILMFLCFTVMTPLGILLAELALKTFFLNFAVEISGFTIGMFLYISLFHLLYEHKLYEKKSRLYFLVGLILPLIFFFWH